MWIETLSSDLRIVGSFFWGFCIND